MDALDAAVGLDMKPNQLECVHGNIANELCAAVAHPPLTGIHHLHLVVAASVVQLCFATAGETPLAATTLQYVRVLYEVAQRTRVAPSVV